MKNVFMVKNSDKAKYKKICSFDDMIVWYQNEKFSIIAPCYLPYKSIYKYIRKLFPHEFIVNTMLKICAIG